MDPFLEHPERWPDVHLRLLAISSDFLTAQLRPKYFVRIAERIYLSDDDEEIHEARLEVIDRELRSVVTVIEVLSPTNKYPGSRGERNYQEKRLEVMRSPSHLVEIDLLRVGIAIEVQASLPAHDYLVHVSRFEDRPKGRLWPIPIQGPLPQIEIPLKFGDAPATLDLQELLTTAYDRGAYDLDIDYRKEPVPALSPDLAEWADHLLKEKRLR
jgi:hypothetical protein